jgi:hypothetical protein
MHRHGRRRRRRGDPRQHRGRNDHSSLRSLDAGPRRRRCRAPRHVSTTGRWHVSATERRPSLCRRCARWLRGGGARRPGPWLRVASRAAQRSHRADGGRRPARTAARRRAAVRGGGASERAVCSLHDAVQRRHHATHVHGRLRLQRDGQRLVVRCNAATHDSEQSTMESPTARDHDSEWGCTHQGRVEYPGCPTPAHTTTCSVMKKVVLSSALTRRACVCLLQLCVRVPVCNPSPTHDGNPSTRALPLERVSAAPSQTSWICARACTRTSAAGR